MPKIKVKSSSDSPSSMMRPALTPEARENQLIALAMDEAEKRIRDGTASSQLITHFLKLGSTRERLEQEKLNKDIQLTEAKKGSIESSRHSEELYNNALAAMKSYSGFDGGNSGDDSNGY